MAGLIRALGLGKALVYGASGGSREALLVAIRHPDVVAGVFCQWLSGGGIGIATLPNAYCANQAIAASMGGMQAVADMPDFQEQVTRNPGNRDRLLAWDADAFIQKMRDWADAFFPYPGYPIPCVKPGDLEGIEGAGGSAAQRQVRLPPHPRDQRGGGGTDPGLPAAGTALGRPRMDGSPDGELHRRRRLVRSPCPSWCRS